MNDLQKEQIISAVLAEIQRQGIIGTKPSWSSDNGGGGRYSQRLERIAVVGAGNGGMAIAAHQTLKGYKVNLFSFFGRELKPIIEKGGIEVFGGVEGFARLNLVTESLEECVKDAQVIMVVAPASSHIAVATLLTPLVKDGQIIVLNPGRTGGSIEFARTMRRQGLRTRPYLAETNTLIYAAETRAPARVEILKEKNKMRVSAFPARDNPVVIPMLQQMYPQIEAGQNVLEIAFNNVGGVFHPAAALLNTVTLQRVAGGEKGLRWYGNMITQPICDMVMEKIDQEKVALCQAFGLDAWPALKWVWESYGVKGNTLFEALRGNPHVAGFSAPGDLYAFHNILDEVPNNLVPQSSFAKVVGVPTPAIDSIVNLACVMTGIDFWTMGRTVESLGLAGMTKEQMLHFVEEVGIQPVKMDIVPERAPERVLQGVS